MFNENISINKFLNFSNILTISRLPISILIIVFYQNWIKIPLILLFILTDVLDGIIARRRNQNTEFGALLDPTVDKISISLLFIFIIPKIGLSVGFIFLFFVRTIFEILGLLMLYYNGFEQFDDLKSKKSGKLTTNLQFITLITLLIGFKASVVLLIWFVAFISIYAIADYSIDIIEITSTYEIRQNNILKSTFYLGFYSIFTTFYITIFASELNKFLTIVNQFIL